MRKILTATAILCAFATSAEARPRHHHHRHFAHHQHRHHLHRYQNEAEGYGYASFAGGLGLSNVGNTNARYSRHSRSSHRNESFRSAHSGGRPAAWCGWYMRQQVGADPGPQYNLARSWAHYGSDAGGPSVGTIVVWRHHVGKIVGQA